MTMESLSEMTSSSSLCPPVPEAELDFHADARQKMLKRLENYQPRSDEDDTVHFLGTFFRFVPSQGQINLANDMNCLSDDDQLRQLVKHLETALLKPMLAIGGMTLAITPSPCTGVEDSIEDLMSLDFDSAKRRQRELRRACLKWDNYQCVLTKAWDHGHSHPPGAPTADLEAAPRIPFSLIDFSEDDRLEHGQIWDCLYRYFPTMRDLFHYNDDDVNRYDHVMMIVSPVHREFGRFSFILEQTDVPDCYRVKTFPRFRSFFKSLMPDMITMTSHDARYPLPNKFLLAVHAAIGNILHATGRGELITKTMRDLDNDGYVLASNGSTNVEELLLSITSLSLLATNPSYRS